MSDHDPADTELILRYVDGLITDAEFDAMQTRLAADAAFRRRFIQLQLRAGYVADTVAPKRSAADADAAKPDQSSPLRGWSKLPVPPPPRTPTLRPPKRLVLSLAAALLLAAAAVAIYVLNLKPETLSPKPTAQPIATVLETSGGGTLVVDDTIVNAGDDIRSGDISLDTGTADFRLTNGVTVRLTGSAQLAVHDPMHATLARGSATFDCPHTAKGYTVHLPGGARVVDLGTRFGVRIAADNRWSVYVTEGLVELRTTDGAAHRIAAGSTGDLRGDGRGVRVAALTEPLPLVAGDFADGAPSIDLLQIGAGVVDYAEGHARFTGSGSRFYLATRHTGYSTAAFTFEATVTLSSRATDASGTAFMGIGPVEPTGKFGTPGDPTAYAEIAPASFANGFVRFHHGSGQTGTLGQGNGGWGDGSTHRVRLTWDPAAGSATFEVDQDYAGDFTADFTHTFKLADSSIEPASSHLFIGAGNGTRWDDVSITLDRPDAEASLPPDTQTTPTADGTADQPHSENP